MADTHATPAPLLGTAYETLGANIIEQTFNERRTQALQGSHEIDSPKVFVDVLAVETMKAYASRNPALGALHVATSQKTLDNGTAAYSVALEDAHGSGVTYSVDSALNVSLTPQQGMPDGRSVRLTGQTFRWNERDGPKDSYLEHSVGNAEPSGRVFVPYANPSLAGGDDFEGGAKLIADNSISSFGAGRQNRPGVIMVSADNISHEGVRTVSASNQFGIITNGYAQAGEITYNGFSVVEQNAGSGKTVYYNKSDLLRNADDRVALEVALKQPGSVNLSFSGDHVHGREVTPHELHVFRDGKFETLHAGFTQSGKVHDLGKFVAQESGSPTHPTYTVFNKQELLEHRSPAERIAIDEALKHHHVLTIGVSPQTVKLDVARAIESHATLGRNLGHDGSTRGIER